MFILNNSFTTNTNLLSEKNQFAIYFPKATYNYQVAINSIFANDLTISGDDTNAVETHNSMYHVQQDNEFLLVFGKSKRFDVEIFSARKSIGNEDFLKRIPVYNSANTEEFEEALLAVKEFGIKKYELMGKYPRNTHSDPMRVLTSLTKNKKKKSTNCPGFIECLFGTKKQEPKVEMFVEKQDNIRVFSNFIIVNGIVYKRNHKNNVEYISTTGDKYIFSGTKKHFSI